MTSATTPKRRRAPHRAFAAMFAVGLLACLFAAQASAAPFGIDEFDGAYTADAAGTPLVQAGSHPSDASVFIDFASFTEETIFGPLEFPNSSFKDILTSIPPGVVGSPLAAPKCSREVFAEAAVSKPSKCPDNTAVGWAMVRPNWTATPLYGPVFNLEPDYGEPALFGFRISSVTIYLHTTLRTGPEPTIMVNSLESSQGLPILWTEVTLWGVPADHSHDEMRGFCLQQAGPTGQSCASTAERKPMISAPTSCNRSLETKLRANSWAEPQNWTEKSFVNRAADGQPALITGCEKLPFEPKLEAQMEPKAAASPGSLDVELAIPQREGADQLVTSHLRKAVVRLPRGVSLNSSAADGLQACSLAQVGLAESAPTSCPPASRIADVDVSTPLLAENLDGSIYLARQHENPFGSMYAVYLVIDDPSLGIYVKVPGRVDVDPATGQVTTTFDENPQVPFDHLRISFAGGPRSALRLPETCGTYTTDYTLTSWSGRTVQGSDSFVVNQNCGKQNLFSPSFTAGTANPVGGAFSAFNLRLTREDGQQNLASLGLKLPPGLLAKLAGVPLCGEAEAATGACPAASKVGTITVAAGVGTDPVYVPQPGREATGLYLAGPYKGGPYSLVAKVPAQAGPFDLGTVAVRNAIHVDPATAQVSVQSDPLPQILAGIPISYRDLRVEVNKPEFTINPTSCDPMSVASTITSAAGTQAHPASRFQVADCGSLGFKPELKLQLKGATKRSGHPALRAVVTYPKEGAYANIARAQVGLPHSEFLDQGNLDKVCKQADLRAGSCPQSSIYGRARAWTPLLDKPLEGPVYLAVGFGYKLPALVADLNGQIRILLVGRIDTTKQKGIRSTFEAVPDAPVSRFELTMKGGKKYGLLENSENTCRKEQRASALFTGQNGDRLQLQPKIANGCGKKKKGHKRKGHAPRR